MSPLWLLITLTAVVAINVTPMKEPASEVAASTEVSELEAAVQAKYGGGVKLQSKQEAVSSGVTGVPPEVRKLEAAVLAKYSAGVPSIEAGQDPADIVDLESTILAKYSMSKAVHNLQPKQESGASGAQGTVPPEVAKLEAAVLAKYSAGVAPSDEAKQDVVHVSRPVPEVAIRAEVLDLEAAVQAKFAAGIKLQSKQESGESGAAPVSPEVSKLEAAVLAKYNVEVPLEEAKQNVGTLTESTPAELTPEVSMPTEVLNLEAEVQAKFGTGVKLQSKQALSASEVVAEVPHEIAKLEAAVQAKYGAGVQSNEATQDVVASSEALSKMASSAKVSDLQATMPAKNNMEPISDEAKWKSNSKTEVKLQLKQKSGTSENSKPQSLPQSSSPTQPVSAKKSQSVVMHDMPHYRNLGAAMHHVDPLPRKSSSNSAPPDSEAKKRAAKLAEKRAEVEDFFHLSKTSGEKVSDAAKLAEKRAEVEDVFHLPKAKAIDPKTLKSQAETEVQVGAGRSLIRFAILLITVLSVVGIAFHKYAVICQMCAPKVKAKQEDFDVEGCGFTAPHLHVSLRTSITGRQGLSRRQGPDTMGSFDYGV